MLFPMPFAHNGQHVAVEPLLLLESKWLAEIHFAFQYSINQHFSGGTSCLKESLLPESHPGWRVSCR
jgi:hypothetical protein